MSDLQVLEQTTVTVGDTEYLIVALPTMFGLALLDHLGGRVGNMPSPEMQAQLIIKSVRYQNKAFTEETFNKHFSRKYKDVFELVKEILEFNLGSLEDEGGDPLDDTEESATS